MATLTGTSGNDFIDGTASSDTIDGLGGNDEMHGEGGADTVIGGAGNDSVGGGAGNDWLEGGLGNDTLGGSGDRDHFVFREFGAANADSILDMSSNWDDIQLDVAAFTQLGATGRFVAGDARFFAGAGATSGHDADDRIIFNTTTHQLFYDADGSGSGASQLIATLTNGANITATDIFAFGTPSSGTTINGTEGDDTLNGTDANETINGLGGNDSITGLGGTDLLIGGDGNDTLQGGDSQPLGNQADTLDGGNGNDEYHVFPTDVVLADPGGIDTIFAVDQSWTLASGFENLVMAETPSGNGQGDGTGNDLANVIDASGIEIGGTYRGLGGNDEIFVGQKQSVAFGGDGNDTIHGDNFGTASISGGAGNDVLDGGTLGSGSVTYVFDVTPGAANADTVLNFDTTVDAVELDGSAFTAIGPTGRFEIGDARFFAAAGASAGHDSDDRIVYDTASGNLWYDADGSGAGAAQLIAAFQGAPALAAEDIAVVNGQAGLTINGTASGEPIEGSNGDDSINGLGGNDTLLGHGGNDTLDGGDGNDQVDGGGGDDLEIGGAGNDILGSSDWAHAIFNPSDPGADTLDGGLGDDSFFADLSDTLIDEGGIDTVMVEGISWTLAAGFENLTFYNHDNDNGFHGLSGTGNDLDNTIDALQGADGIVARGLGGNDSLIGTNYSDTLDGGTGNDTLIGQGGDPDTFVFSATPGAANADLVTGFASGIDKVELDGNFHPNIGPSGNFAADDERFFAGTGATSGHDATDRVVYDTTSGNLWYDADGSGSSAAQLVATLQGAPALAATDIEVINGTAAGGATEGDDTLVGTPVDDTIDGLGGNDSISGLAGNDSLRGGDGDDTLVGGDGNDTLDANGPVAEFNSDFNNVLDGGLGDDTYIVATTASAGDTILADPGGHDLVIVEHSSHWTLGAGLDDLTFNEDSTPLGIGNELDNVIFGGFAGGELHGMGGNDELHARGAGGGTDLFGEDGNDALFADEEGDRLDGGAGNDTLTGGSGADSMDGGDGDDTYYVTGIGDVLTDSSGTDTIFTDALFTSLGAAFENLTMLGSADLDADGNASANVLTGNAGSNEFHGNQGDDTILGNAGADSVGGGSGSDWLEGGSGNDTLGGSGDRDHFVFDSYGEPNADLVLDMSHNWDDIRLDANAFADLGATGRFTSGDARFFSGAGATAAHDATDRVVYDTSTGNLYYDHDGSGGDAAQLVATLQGAPAITSTDIWSFS